MLTVIRAQEGTAAIFALSGKTYRLAVVPTQAALKDISPKAFVLLEDQKAGVTQGGTFTAGDWRTRDMNAEVIDTDDLASISSNQILLASDGKWRVHASAPASRVNTHWLRLRDIDNNVTLLEGPNAYASVLFAETHTHAVLLGEFTLSAPIPELELQHRCMVTRASDGFGIAGGDRDPQVYSQIAFWKP